jgi:hypothetical protein
MEFQRAFGVRYSYRDELQAVVFEQLSDAALHRIKPYLERSKKSLEELILGGDGVTDAGMDELKGLANLRRLTLIGTGVTAAGLSRLRQALPKLDVVRLPRGSPAPTPLPPSGKLTLRVAGEESLLPRQLRIGLTVAASARRTGRFRRAAWQLPSLMPPRAPGFIAFRDPSPF